MYRIYLKIYIDNTGSTTIEDYVDFDREKISLKKVNERGRFNYTATGSLVISGPDYEKFFSSINSGTYFNGYMAFINIYQDDTLIFDRKLCELEYNNQPDGIASFKLKNYSANQIYSSVYNSWDIKKEIKSITPYDIIINQQIYTEFKTTTGTATFETEKFSLVDRVAITDDYLEGLSDSVWTAYYVNFTFNSLNCTNKTITLNTSITWYARKKYGYYFGTKSISPGEGWVYLKDQVISTITYPVYIKNINVWGESKLTFTQATVTCTGIKYYYYATIAHTDLEAVGSMTIHDGGRKITDVITYLFQQIDSGITTDSNSYSSLANYTGLTDQNSDNHTFANMLLCTIPDIKPNYEGNEKAHKSEKISISLKSILDWFEDRGFYWYLEEISGITYIRLKLLLDKTLASGNPEIKNYYSIDWSYRANNYKSNPVKFYGIINETKSGTFEFNLEAQYIQEFVSPTKTLTDNNILTDSNFIYANRDEFSDTDTSQFVMLATYPVAAYEVKETFAYNTELDTTNYELSFQYLFLNTMGYFPSKYIPVYGITIDNTRLDKRKEIELLLPNYDIEDFDFSGYIKFLGNETEIAEISKKLSDNYIRIKLIL